MTHTLCSALKLSQQVWNTYRSLYHTTGIYIIQALVGCNITIAKFRTCYAGSGDKEKKKKKHIENNYYILVSQKWWIRLEDPVL